MNKYDSLAEKEKGRVRITAIKVMGLRQHGGQALVKVETDAGVSGIGEAGASAATARASLRNFEPVLIGQDPVEIDRLYLRMSTQMHSSMADIPTLSGVDIALWDIAGKLLGRPISTLLSGRFRDEIDLYMNTAGPENWLDPAARRDWAQELKADPAGWKVIKFGFERLMGGPLPRERYGVAQLSQMLTQSELAAIRVGYEHCREALGWERDIIVHCHNEWDVPSAIGLAEAVAPIKPLWLEDALPVPYSDGWRALKQASPVRIATGEKLETPRDFLPFMRYGALDVIHPDLAYAGGITGCRKIADLAELFYIPVVTHCVGTLVHMAATAHFGASTRNFMMSETRLAHANHLVDQIGTQRVVVRDGRMKVPTDPGLGIILDPEALKANLAPGETYWD
jgi:L-alanine-DL-glutamate epimerase-like enolase superfamily enzyme